MSKAADLLEKAQMEIFRLDLAKEANSLTLDMVYGALVAIDRAESAVKRELANDENLSACLTAIRHVTNEVGKYLALFEN